MVIAVVVAVIVVALVVVLVAVVFNFFLVFFDLHPGPTPSPCHHGLLVPPWALFLCHHGLLVPPWANCSHWQR